MPSRAMSNRIRFVLDEILPPIIRDSRLMEVLLRAVLGKQGPSIAHFRENAYQMTEDEFTKYYREMKVLQGESDNTSGCVAKVLNDIKGSSVCDVGCGRGHLIAEIAKLPNVKQASGIDIIIDDQMRKHFPMVEFYEGRIENLPFGDKSYDTVVCTHTIEHIPNLAKAISELRRISRETLIIVVPMERRYKFGFNLHVNFFTYRHVFLEQMVPLPKQYECSIIDGEIYYC